MEIRPANDARHYIVADPVVSPELLLGCSKRKVKGEYLVEANYLNMYQLGIPFKVKDMDKEINFTGTKLFDYQKRDVQRMVQQRHVFNGNRMGYGKTVEAISTLRELDSNYTLILAPKTVLPQWEKELQKWWPECGATILVKPTPVEYAKAASRGLRPSGQGPSKLLGGTIVITNYEALQNQKLLQQLKGVVWDAIVLDESHRIKNRRSKRWAYVMELPAKHKICLSGTPILRRVDDLWAQWFFLNWRYSGLSYWNFVDFFCEVKTTPFGKEIGALTTDPDKVRLLNWLVDLVCIRNPDMVLSQGKRSIIIDLKLEGKQKELYKNTRDLALDTLPENLTIASGMAHVLRLRQVTSCPEQFDQSVNNTKFDWIEEMLEDNPDLKVVVYSCWSTPLKQLQKRLGEKVCKLYIGGGATHEQLENKALFIQDKAIRVLAGTIGALGTGVDGLQSVCSTTIFIDKDWSPEINAQAEDRLNRYGQQQVCNNFYLECIGTMDRHVSRLNMSKAEDIRIALMDEEV